MGDRLGIFLNFFPGYLQGTNHQDPKETVVSLCDPSYPGRAGDPPPVPMVSGGVESTGAISASDDLFRYTFSADNAKTSVAGFGRWLFWAPLGPDRLIFVRKIGRCRSIPGGKAGSGRAARAAAGQNEWKGCIGRLIRRGLRRRRRYRVYLLRVSPTPQSGPAAGSDCPPEQVIR